MLQKIVNIIDAAGTGIFNRNDGIVSLAGLHLLKDIGELRAAAFDKLFKVAGGVLTSRKVRI